MATVAVRSAARIRAATATRTPAVRASGCAAAGAGPAGAVRLSRLARLPAARCAAVAPGTGTPRARVFAGRRRGVRRATYSGPETDDQDARRTKGVVHHEGPYRRRYETAQSSSSGSTRQQLYAHLE